MPRSGGEYVYNSRIIHPIYGIAQSFGDAAIWLMWIYVLAPLAVDPGLTMTFNYLGWTGAANWLTSSTAGTRSCVATLFNVIGFLFVVFGIKIFALVQKIVMFFGIGGCIVIGVVLTVTRGATSMAKWNAAAAATSYGPTYHQLHRQVGSGRRQVMPRTPELGRHVRLHGRHVVAVRLRLLDLVHRRRGQAPGQDRSSCPTCSPSPCRSSSCSGSPSCSTRRSASSS